MCQSYLNSEETLDAFDQFQRICLDSGVIPQKFISDNGKAFTSKAFQEHLQQFKQTIDHAAPGAHHHNAIAERAIYTITAIARSLLIHCGLYWPEVADVQVWPMAVAHAVWLYNHMPNLSTGLSPHDLFTKTRFPQSKFHDLHVFGCPVYVLKKQLQDGKKIPRWEHRSNRCQLMGFSPSHSSTSPLVLNLDTGAITAQYHVVFDDWFATVASTVEELPPFHEKEWSQMFGSHTYHQDPDEDSSSDEEGDINPPSNTDTRSAVEQSYATPLAPPPPEEKPKKVTWGDKDSRRPSLQREKTETTPALPSPTPILAPPKYSQRCQSPILEDSMPEDTHKATVQSLSKDAMRTKTKISKVLDIETPEPPTHSTM